MIKRCTPRGSRTPAKRTKISCATSTPVGQMRHKAAFFLLNVIVVSNDVEKESFYRFVFILSFAVYSTFNGSWMLDSSIFHSIFQSIKYPNDVAINTTLDNLIRPFVYGKGKWVSVISPNKTFICLG